MPIHITPSGHAIPCDMAWIPDDDPSFSGQVPQDFPEKAAANLPTFSSGGTVAGPGPISSLLGEQASPFPDMSAKLLNAMQPIPMLDVQANVHEQSYSVAFTLPAKSYLTDISLSAMQTLGHGAAITVILDKLRVAIVADIETKLVEAMKTFPKF